ncbi:MAG: anhydro-N-acetylmuramic acid kinase [Bacteroidales bacterium]|nr:anhydro-N-acetylmuramic acid kinase [Bacteroidales bacterium]
MVSLQNIQENRLPIFLGLMSGTSLDGLDMAFCTFTKKDANYSFQLLYAETLEYDSTIKKMLQQAPLLSGLELIKADRIYGHYLGKAINSLIKKTHIKPDYVASHGHTVFHVPHEKFTFQMGHGPSIAAECGLPVIFDFRSLDVALDGQGAPLVPIGDQSLFGDYQACVNMGGFSNVSYEQNGSRVAFDICPVNFVANFLAQKTLQPFDKDGLLGKQGVVLPHLLEKFLLLPYHQTPPPKSLGREWVETNFFPIFLNSENQIPDLLRTLYEYIAQQIIRDIPFKNGKVLFTGGGVKNRFLMQLIQDKASWEVVIPDYSIIDYKEAIIFAFMAFLKINHQKNCLSSVTGATCNCSAGSIAEI